MSVVRFTATGTESARPTMPQGDPALLPYLQARDETQARTLLEDLVTRHVEPAARAACARHLRAAGSRPGPLPDAEALQAHVVRTLTERLRDLRRPASSPGDLRLLGELRVYLGAQAEDACRGWLRGAFPHRILLAHRLRYLLARDRRFLLRPTPDDDWRCGLAGRDARLFSSGEAAGPGKRIPPEPASRPRDASEADPAKDPAALADRIFDLIVRAGGPVDFEHLVDTLEEWVTLSESPAPEDAPAPAPALAPATAALAGAAPPPAASEDPNAWLRRFWDEIVALPPLQRAAFLLNLRDGAGRGAIGLLPVTGVADLRRLAAVLDMTPGRLADRWRTLPLDDAAIAARLGLTRHYVLMLRRAARERLARRLL
jgi:hypothetical protein